MLFLILESWRQLLYFDWLMFFGGFEKVHEAVRRQQHVSTKLTAVDPTTICRAIDLACVFYFKQVLCLQRSAVTVTLLRQKGWDAQMVIGAQLLPFQSHAWVEIQGDVVNDRPYITRIFQTLDRC